MKVAISMVAGAVLSLGIAGCGGSQTGETSAGPLVEDEEPVRPAGPINASGDTEARATVAAQGGTLSLRNGARLEIPTGALSEPIEVILRRGAEGHAFGDAERQRPLGPMLNIEPGLVASDGTFTISVPSQTIPSGFEEADLAFAMEEVDDQQRAIDTLGTQTRWQFYPVRVENGRWVAQVRGLAGHRVQFGVAR